MTALPLRDFTDAERAKLEAIEAAPAAEEGVRERVARAMWEANNPALAAIYTPDKVAELWAGGHGTPSGDRYREQTDAALAVLSGPRSDAERAVEVADIRDDSGYYHGKVGTPAEHRTVGDYRAWCHDCGEWCYPSAPCGEPKCCTALTEGQQPC